MRKCEITMRLGTCGIHCHDDAAVPTNGQAFPLPYLIVHGDDQRNGDDVGFIAIVSTSWRLSLCTASISDDLEQMVLRSLTGVGQIAVTRQQFDNYHQTDFEFTTTEIVKGA